MSKARYTSDHRSIRTWVEDRGGRPAAVAGTADVPGDAGILRIDFPGYGDDEALEHISWDEWFAKFDENDLVMLLQDDTAGGETSRFNKIVARSSVRGREDSEA